MNDPTSSSLNALLKLTSQRLGTTPEVLQQAAQSGDLSRMLSGAGADDAEALRKVLNDPEAAKKLLSTPQAQKLMELFSKERS